MKVIGWALVVVGGLAALIGGIQQLTLGWGLFSANWGVVGIVLFLFLPPLWIAAPFLAWWIGGSFPADYFTLFVVTIVGGFLMGIGRATAGIDE